VNRCRGNALVIGHMSSAHVISKEASLQIDYVISRVRPVPELTDTTNTDTDTFG